MEGDAIERNGVKSRIEGGRCRCRTAWFGSVHRIGSSFGDESEDAVPDGLSTSSSSCRRSPGGGDADAGAAPKMTVAASTV